jgi:hypothetical protein
MPWWSHLGVTVDEDKLMTYHESCLHDGEYVPFGTGCRPRR